MRPWLVSQVCGRACVRLLLLPVCPGGGEAWAGEWCEGVGAGAVSGFQMRRGRGVAADTLFAGLFRQYISGVQTQHLLGVGSGLAQGIEAQRSVAVIANVNVARSGRNS